MPAERERRTHRTVAQVFAECYGEFQTEARQMAINGEVVVTSFLVVCKSLHREHKAAELFESKRSRCHHILEPAISLPLAGIPDALWDQKAVQSGARTDSVGLAHPTREKETNQPGNCRAHK